MKNRFRYYAVKKTGTLKIGTIKASDYDQALVQLQNKYATIYLLEPAPRINLSMLTTRIGIEEKLIFVKNFHVILKSGIALDESLKIIADQSVSPSMKKIAKHLMKQVQAGNHLYKALFKYQHIFDSFFINMIYIGERSGTLDTSLEYLSQELEHGLTLRRKIKSASFYPGIILIVTTILGSIVLKFILPKLINVFNSISVELPPITRAFILIAEFIDQHWGILIIGSIGIIIAFRLFIKISAIRLIWLALLLHLPLIGNIVRDYNLAQLTRSIALLLKSGTPVLEALDTTARATTNLYYKVELLKAKEHVSQGSSLGEALSKNKQFTVLSSELVEIGEKSGNLAGNLDYLSQFYNNKIEYFTRNISTVIEPVLLITIGLIVAFVAIAIITPIYDFTANVGR